MEKLLETDRLYFRKLTPEDIGAIGEILADDETMYAYGGKFSKGEIQDWLDKQLENYQKYKLGL